MTGDARLWSVLKVNKLARVNMALGADQRRVFADQVERNFVVVKVRPMRFDSIMTGHAVCAERQEMFCGEYLIILQVTVSARLLIKWRGIPGDMAILTYESAPIGLHFMRGQLEQDSVVIKGSWSPAAGVVTGSALCAKSTGVSIIFQMAGRAVLRSAFEQVSFMAVCASHRRMFTDKRESELGMIHSGGLPAFGGMAGGALRSQLTLVRVIFLMAGSAVLRRAFKDSVLMTAFASHGGMFSIETECEQGMIHLCILPAFGRMTCCAVGPKLTVMVVVFRMAGETRLGSYLQINDRTRVDMALGTCKWRMFPDQIEWNFIMIKTKAM